MKHRLQVTHTPATPRSPITQTVRKLQHQDAVYRNGIAPGICVLDDIPRAGYADLDQISRLPFAEIQLNWRQYMRPKLLEGEPYASIN